MYMAVVAIMPQAMAMALSMVCGQLQKRWAFILHQDREILRSACGGTGGINERQRPGCVWIGGIMAMVIILAALTFGAPLINSGGLSWDNSAAIARFNAKVEVDRRMKSPDALNQTTCTPRPSRSPLLPVSSASSVPSPGQRNAA